MIASFLNELFSTLVETLPSFFIRGMPYLAIAIVLAALIDTRLPGRVSREPTR